MQNFYLIGKTNPKDKGIMVEWEGNNELNYWSSKQCNKVTGRDPSGLPLAINKSDVMNLFIGQLCRSLDFLYEKNVLIDNEFHGK